VNRQNVQDDKAAAVTTDNSISFANNQLITSARAARPMTGNPAKRGQPSHNFNQH
jgi:hypothetical protein